MAAPCGDKLTKIFGIGNEQVRTSKTIDETAAELT